MQKSKSLAIQSTSEVKDKFLSFNTGYDAKYIFRKANEELLKSKNKGEFTISSDSFYYKAMTILEFDKGVLLSNAVSSLDNPFVLELFNELQKEFNCQTASEKSLAEITALNFMRILAMQRKLKDIQTSVKTRYDVQYIAVLSKELDRAERHYLTSLQTLRMLKMPQLEVNIKTQNAFVGNNQLLQKNEIN